MPTSGGTKGSGRHMANATLGEMVASDEYRLEDVEEDHPIGAALFVPFAVWRLSRGLEEAASMTVDLRGIMDQGDCRRNRRLRWGTESIPTKLPAVQERVVTEWGACGVACMVMSVFTRMRVHAVAADGDRFDYWVGDGAHEYALEVSGTMADDVEARHREKVRQLRANPYGVDGFVVVVSFATRKVVLSFNRFKEGL